MDNCEDCGGEVSEWYTTDHPVHVGSCTKCFTTVIQGVYSTTVDSSNYAGTGHSLSELESMPQSEADDALAASLYAVRRHLKLLGIIEQQAEGLLRQRILEREGANRAETPQWRTKLAPSTAWGYIDETIADLQKHIAADEFDHAVPLIPAVAAYRKPNKARLNELAKRGGEVKRIIDAGCIPQSTTYKVEVEKKS